MSDATLYFAFPGDLNTPSGGYHYDRRLIAGLRDLGLTVHELSLPSCLPELNKQARDEAAHALAALPDDALVIIDGLAFGVLDQVAEQERQRLRIVALCHHPLALETGLDAHTRTKLQASEQRALACTRATIVTSAHTRDILVEQFAVPADRITVALPGTEPVSFAPCDGDPVRLLCIASLTRRKAHDVLIEALAQLTELPWQARFVGGAEFDPQWARDLQSRVSELGLDERIEFAGSASNTQPEYQQADVFVLPSRYEGYGMVFAEALAAGLPIIAARAGAVPQVVPDSAGLLVEADDVEGLRDALHRVLSDASLRQQLQRGAREAAQNLPRWSDTAARVAQSLESL